PSYDTHNIHSFPTRRSSDLYEINENFSDSLIYNEPPRYVTNTLDSLRTFELTNLKAGTYQMVAIKDLNNDYKYNPGKEKIAFIKDRKSTRLNSSHVKISYAV